MLKFLQKYWLPVAEFLAALSLFAMLAVALFGGWALGLS